MYWLHTSKQCANESIVNSKCKAFCLFSNVTSILLFMLVPLYFAHFAGVNLQMRLASGLGDDTVIPPIIQSEDCRELHDAASITEMWGESVIVWKLTCLRETDSRGETSRPGVWRGNYPRSPCTHTHIHNKMSAQAQNRIMIAVCVYLHWHNEFFQVKEKCNIYDS